MIAFVLAGCMMSMSKEWVEYEGKSGPGKGKHIVLIAGDEEYRSEEGLPQLAKILAFRHGFRCTVLFSVNEKGEIDPNLHTNQPGLEALDKADLCIMLLRFRTWPDAQMKHLADYYLSGRPIIALRTSTHAFDYPADSTSLYRKFGWNSAEWPGGFGKQVLGETWISHWGNHGSQATRGVIDKPHPILTGVHGVFGTTDVYEAAPPSDATIIMRGEVVAGMTESDPMATGRKRTRDGREQDLNDPRMPIAWIREVPNEKGHANKVLTTTMGAATDLLNEGFRRFLVNASYWSVNLGKIPARANVDFIGKFEPSKFGFEGFKKGVKPSDLSTSP